MKKDRVKDKFIEELERVPVVSVACKKCGISRQTAYRWRGEDPQFHDLWMEALEEGEAVMNDITESQLLTLIKEKHYSAIRYWLDRRHPKFKKQEKVVEERPPINKEKLVKDLGITSEDIKPENYGDTLKRIADYLGDRG